MVAFLQPSDLHHIDLTSVNIIEVDTLYALIHINPTLCSVIIFVHLREPASQLLPPPSVAFLFVNSNGTVQVSKITTIRQLSLELTSDLVSPQALCSYIPLDDAVTLGS
ncbi:hypothetical protein BCV72DRAFT_306524 [Rhizopus microsporus var. microsporus]|uniref:Uncharacterized protein n=2 Tax=Rhizopus microsporus TaxID=58291 RepID=A0A2G4SQC8_RHIZD|nr:uncharacterized protein RHIMIDRAFT_239114 [Rhizopus microsporus ATCC 52813]ORE05285.1 hypothetical protein BCV72DRAFT_306524 [Rhizopus microsporus var. microsporus]PHZ10960.1 hypothetical protein RHIMIDRAFT_239114 [Rhizopus microsporus ATCC 52813]